jgi:hypothetical protein
MQQAVAEAALALAMDEYIGSSDAKAVRSAGLERMNPADPATMPARPVDRCGSGRSRC